MIIDPDKIGFLLVALMLRFVASLINELSTLMTEVLVSVPYVFGVTVIEVVSSSIPYEVPESVTEEAKLIKLL